MKSGTGIVFVFAILTIYRKFLEQLGEKTKRTTPESGKDILFVNIAQMSKVEAEAVLKQTVTKAAELNVPVLIQNYVSVFGPIGKNR